MKKSVFVVGMTAMVLAFAVVFVSCSSAPFVYDTTVSPEESSTLIISGCQVNKFNGETVSMSKWNAAMGEKTVIIPAGTHTFEVWNSASGIGGTSIEIGHVDVTHTFLPGHTYFLTALIYDGSINGRIIDKDIFSIDLVPDPTSPDASPIEGKWKITDGKTTNELIFAKGEYARFINGNYLTRGYFQIKGNSVSMTVAAVYNSKKETWDIIALPLSGGNLSYNGTSWFLGKFELQKVE